MVDDMIRVYLVDDHPLVREGLRLVLERPGGFEVVGEAGRGRSAAAAAVRAQAAARSTPAPKWERPKWAGVPRPSAVTREALGAKGMLEA